MMKNVRVISLIPSITETLIECGVEIVGRTRYCVHPKPAVESIPILGGTKRVQTEDLLRLNPDLVILDREENTKEVAESIQALNLKMHVMHVISLKSLTDEFTKLSQVIENKDLADLARRMEQLVQWRSVNKTDLRENFLRTCAMPSSPWSLKDFGVPRELNYLIWKKPWMTIGPGTYIQDVLSFGGFFLAHQSQERYPKLTTLPDEPTLFSSEPYPFAREWEEIKKAVSRSLLVDGEKISWFGIRSLRFLEALIGEH